MTQKGKSRGLLTPAEHSEVNDLADMIENLNAERLTYLIQLAELRSIPLAQLMDQLGKHPSQ